MPTTTRFEFGDIVLVPFPFTDQTTAKKRPAAVVSSAAYLAERPDVVIMAITSQATPAGSIGEASIVEWKQAGLLKPSVFKPLLDDDRATIGPPEAGTSFRRGPRSVAEVAQSHSGSLNTARSWSSRVGSAGRGDC
jgi:mRNA interferase MazF